MSFRFRALWFVSAAFLLPPTVVLLAQGPGTALVQRAPAFNAGTVEGSVQVMRPESVTLNGGAAITGDLLVPGLPAVRLNGRPALAGIRDGTGAATPTAHQITLNGGVALRQVVRRTDAGPWPTVAAPPAPEGTRAVALAQASQAIGDFATLRNLTLNGNSGLRVVPPGTYGDFVANGGGGFVLGVVGGNQPAVYHFQRLVLNGQSPLRVVGPVVVTVAHGLSLHGALGDAANPAWLALKVAAGDVTLNGGAALHGYVTAPGGTVTLNGGSLLVGGVTAERLTLNGGAVLRLVEQTTNQPPVIALTSPATGSEYEAPAAFALTAAASDPDGRIVKVEFRGGGGLLGEALAPPYAYAVSGLAVGDHVFTARAIDERAAETESAPITVRVRARNQLPTVHLVTPTDGAVVAVGASVVLSAIAADADQGVARVEFWSGETRLGERTTAPYEWLLTNLAAGTHAFRARATDRAGAGADSPVVRVRANAPPIVTLTAPPGGSRLTAPATVTLEATAADADGTVARVEFFRGTLRLGEVAVPPFRWTLEGLEADAYAFHARAIDNDQAVAVSAPVNVLVVRPNTAPSVEMLRPADGTVFTAPASIQLAAVASDAEGALAKVEFFAGATKIGEGAGPAFEYLWPQVPPGAYGLTARVQDADGLATTSRPIQVTVRIGVPYFTGFEPGDGYPPGTWSGGNGWEITGGAAIGGPGALRGTQAALLGGAAGAGVATLTLPPAGGEAVSFVDIFTRGTVAESPGAGWLRTEAAAVALVRTSGGAEWHVRDGPGGAWRATGVAAAVGADGRMAEWVRLTVREDYAAQRWDLYVQGRMVAADLGFAAATMRPAKVMLAGEAAPGGNAFDELYVGFENPLFVDADRDGLDDAWERANGLNVAANDRAADADGDGLGNLREFVLGTRASAADSDGDGMPDGWEVRFGLNPLLNDATGDRDADGVPNQREFLLGRDPTRIALPDTTGAVQLRLHSPLR